jgi:hypothetical protein
MIIIIIIVIQSIYNYIPETNHVSRACNSAAFLCFLHVVHIMLCPCLMFCTFTIALSEVFVQCPIWLFSVVPLFRALLVCGSCIF